MANKTHQSNRLLFGAALGAVAGYIIYTVYKQQQQASAVAQAIAAGSPSTVLETLTTNSPTTGTGATSVAVPGVSTLPLCSNITGDASLWPVFVRMNPPICRLS